MLRTFPSSSSSHKATTGVSDPCLDFVAVKNIVFRSSSLRRKKRRDSEIELVLRKDLYLIIIFFYFIYA